MLCLMCSAFSMGRSCSVAFYVVWLSSSHLPSSPLPPGPLFFLPPTTQEHPATTPPGPHRLKEGRGHINQDLMIRQTWLNDFYITKFASICRISSLCTGPEFARPVCCLASYGSHSDGHLETLPEVQQRVCVEGGMLRGLQQVRRETSPPPQRRR